MIGAKKRKYPVLVSTVAAASLVAQAVFFTSLGFMLFDLLGLANAMTPQMEADPGLLVPLITETIVSYQPALGIGVIGAIVSLVVYMKSTFRASWYLKGTRIAGWLWVPIVPVGTFIGIVLLGARKTALEPSAGDT